MRSSFVFSFSVAALLLSVFFSGQANAAKKPRAATAVVNAEDPADKLEKQFQQFSAEFYVQYIQHEVIPPYNALDQLNARVKGYIKNKTPIPAVANILNNYSLVAKNPNNPIIVDFIAILLDQNEWQTANKLYTLVKEEADKNLIANVSYFFAKYHFARNKWQLTLDILEGVANDLPPDRNHHALIMQGISLQRLKDHRTSLSYYEKIPSSSKYYTVARLNMAIAYIRQDWWTDAHTILEGLVKNPKVLSHEETVDRLYTVLGYSFLRLQYYRNSRDAFRSVGLNSHYTNRALLGIALTAANQEDYIGALNAVRVLKEKSTIELPVEEAHLLTPFFYEKLKQHATATTGYNEAINFYEQRIQEINRLIGLDTSTYKTVVSFDAQQKLFIDKFAVDISAKAPESFTNNYQLLVAFRPFVDKFAASRLTQEYHQTETTYATALQKFVHTVLNERIEHLTSYMNQSRYGIARLYDNKESAN